MAEAKKFKWNDVHKEKLSDTFSRQMIYESLKVNYNTQSVELSKLKEEFPEYKNIYS